MTEFNNKNNNLCLILLAVSAIILFVLSSPVSAATPPADGVPMPAKVLLQQHEVEVVASPRGTLIAGWTDDVDPQAGGPLGWRCSVSVSTDHGKSWSTPIVYKNVDYALSGNTTVAADASGNLYAVCMSVTSDDSDPDHFGKNSKGVLEISKSKDNGAHWSPWQTVTAKQDGYIPDRPKLIAYDNERLNLVYTLLDDAGDSPHPIMHLSSKNGGESWSPEEKLSPAFTGDTPGDQGAKLVRDHQGRILASWGREGVWRQGGSSSLYFAISNDGEHFTAPVKINDQAIVDGPACTEMAIDSSGKNILISRHIGHMFHQIDLVQSSDGGKTWKWLKPVSANGINEAFVFDNKDQLHLMWTERNKQHFDTRYATSSDAGLTFTPSVSLAGGGYETRFREENNDDFLMLNNEIGSYVSLLLSSDQRLHAFWIDWRTNEPRLYYSSWRESP